MNSDKKVFIYGVPGTGKTYLSKLLGKKLNLPVVEGDKIKSKLKQIVSKKQSPFLYLGTCQAYKEFGELNRENTIKGMLAVRSALSDAVADEIKDRDNFILEGAFLDPNLLIKTGKVILLVVLDEARHKKQFLNHREKLLDFTGNEFKAARIIQDYFIDEAKKLGVEIKS